MAILDSVREEAQSQALDLITVVTEKIEEAYQAKLQEHYQFLLAQAEEAREMNMGDYADALEEAARVLAETFELPVDEEEEEEASEEGTEESSEEESDDQIPEVV